MRSPTRRTGGGIRRGAQARLVRWVRDAYEAVSWLHVAVFLFYGMRTHPAYGLTWRRRLALARRMRRNTRRVQTGLSYRGHLAIAAKVFDIPPGVEGVIVEAGCWKGGTTVNLSLIAAAVGRTLVVYDSFEGLPPPVDGDHWASEMGVGAFKGELEEVRSNVERYGAIEVCEFRKGWFADTMGDHSEPVVLAYIDVDYQSSLHDCILGLWPHLVQRGYVFIDEYTRLDYCALFFSERYWRTYFDRPPPGLMGAGSGVGIGQVSPGPYREFRPLQNPASVAWTRKDFYGAWDFEAGDEPAEPFAGGGIGDPRSRVGWTLTAQSMQENETLHIAKLLETSEEARHTFGENFASRIEQDEAVQQAFSQRMAEQLEKDAALQHQFFEHLVRQATEAALAGSTLDPEVEDALRRSVADHSDDPRVQRLLAALDGGTGADDPLPSGA